MSETVAGVDIADRWLWTRRIVCRHGSPRSREETGLAVEPENRMQPLDSPYCK
ncbi:hypothetical protein [Haladaptatus caseinilyticus]|uniref:hypothetical protein n=1 Tax=Haladaptatus caseinilyticus TaxID=2993314 RepID=UPI00224B81D4|nr:hypothetical protein [Haladaptatus caseinilyticus]